jgi:simple sugar transport system ATP-binding protein
MDGPDEPAARLNGDPPLLEARAIGKRFGHIDALLEVDFRVGRGEVVGLLGDNGAGKSTLIKVITGVYPPDTGQLYWEGGPVHFRSPREAYARGIATVYQDLAVVDLMSIHRNMFLGREHLVSWGWGPFRFYDTRRARREAQAALRDIGIEIRSPDEPVMMMSGGERQSIAIARGVHFSAKLLILDEPTSALSVKESAKVLYYIESARERGLSVIFITHNVHQVYPVADRFTILSLGRSVADFRRGEVSQEQISDMIVHGHELRAELRRKEREA